MTQEFERRGMKTVLLDLREAAAYLAISESNLRRLQWEKKIPYVRIGRAVRFKVEQLDKHIEEHTQGKKKTKK